jgi:hypothetical protein
MAGFIEPACVETPLPRLSHDGSYVAVYVCGRLTEFGPSDSNSRWGILLLDLPIPGIVAVKPLVRISVRCLHFI